MDLDVINLNILAKKLAVEFFGMELDIPIMIENLSCWGKCYPVWGENNKLIDMSHIAIDSAFITTYPEKYIRGVVLHELCHWTLFRKGLPCDDRANEFRDEMLRVGALFPDDIPLVGDLYSFRCKKCYRNTGVFSLHENLMLLKEESNMKRCIHCGSRIKYFGIENVTPLEAGLEN